MDTAAVLARERDAIVDDALDAIRRFHLTHYDHSEPQEVRARVERLVDRLQQAVGRRDLGPMVAYGSTLARERYTAGFALSEVQAAMNAVEEAAWARIVATVPPEELGESLGVVASVLGAGKDALARTYVSLATRTRTPALDLRKLFAGTVGG